MIKFQDFDSFINTIDFFNCANATQIDNWFQQISIQTIEKEYRAFMTQIQSEDHTDEETLNLIDQYNGRINGSLIDSTWTFGKNYSTYTEFRNLDGVYLIGERIEAEFENTRISIFDGDFSKLDAMRNDPNFIQNISNYESDPEIVILRHPDYGDPICCDRRNEDRDYYDNDDKRITSSYSWTDVSMFENVTGGFICFPIIRLSIKHESERRGAFWFWDCHNRNWDHSVEMPSHIFPPINDTQTLQRSWITVWANNPQERYWGCEVDYDLDIRGSSYGPFESTWFPVLCPFEIEYTTDLLGNPSNPPEYSHTLSCEEHPPLGICTECPNGYTYSNATGNCVFLCVPGAFIYQNVRYYPSINGACPFGGTLNNSGACDLGWHTDPNYTYFVEVNPFDPTEKCFAAIPKCPD